MEKHIIDVFVPHKKLRTGYYLVSALLLLLWLPDLNKLNIPLPSKVLETWFLDKLLLTTIVLLLLYAFSTYFLSYNRNSTCTENFPLPPQKQEEQPEQPIQLDMPKRDILLFLSLKPEKSIVTALEIAQRFEMDEQAAIYHLEELVTKKMIYVGKSINAPKRWSIAQPGRKYLIENGKIV